MKVAKQPRTFTTPSIPEPQNLYLDRVTTFEACRKLFSSAQHYYGPDWERNVHCIAGGELFLTTALGLGFKTIAERVNCTAPHNEFYQAAFTTWNTDRGYFGDERTLKAFNPDTWRYIRDIARFQSINWLLSREEHNRLSTENPLWNRTPLWDNTHGFVFQRCHLPYYKTLYSKLGVFFNPRHFVHVMLKDPGFIRYTPDQASWEKDVTVQTTLTKYLRNFYPHLTDTQLQWAADLHKMTCVEDGIEFFTSAEDIIRVYANGPTSCMSKDADAYGGHVNPLVAYANRPGVKLAAMRTSSTNGEIRYSARCFVYEASETDKRYIRSYGEETITGRLERRGYKPGNWADATLAKIPALDKYGKPLPETYIMPYLDDRICRNDYPVQYVVTHDGLDHWVAVTSRSKLFEEKAKRELIDCQSPNGLAGLHKEYRPARHRKWYCRINGLPYDQPQHGVFNEHGETLCSHCGEPVERSHATAALSSRTTLNGYYCRASSCMPALLSTASTIRINEDLHYDGLPAVVLRDYVVGISKDPDAACITGRDISSGALAKYTFIFADEIEEHGLIRLGRGYNYKFVRMSDKFVSLNNEWVLKNDLITTVTGTTELKQNAWFLGQNNNEEMQYFAPDPALLWKEFKLGRFSIEGKKIIYDSKGRFKPVDRDELLKILGEAHEDDDESKTLLHIPLIEAINTIHACLVFEFFDANPPKSFSSIVVQDSLFEQLRSLLPRVNAVFFSQICECFHHLQVDRFAGLNGITRLTPQIYETLSQHLLPADKAFTNEKPPATRRPALTMSSYFTHTA